MKLIKIPQKVLHIILVLSLGLMVILTACSGQNNKTSPSDQSPSPAVSSSSKPSASVASDTAKIDNSSAKITVMTQEYTGDNIAEILMISYDGEQPDLEEYGGKNPEIESFDNAVKWGVQQIYNDFMENHDDRSWIEIRSYPFISANYLQIITTCAVYPNYGTDGDLYSYNFDLKENRFMSIDGVLQDLQLDRDSITDTVRGLVKDYYKDNYVGTTAGDVDVAGFLIMHGPSGPLTQLLLQVEEKFPESDTCNSFFGYTPELGELVKLNSQCLFDPSDMHQMDPPLSYQRDTDIKPVSVNSALTFDTEGMEEIVSGCEYLLDGMVYFTVEKLPTVSHSQEAVLEQIKSLETDKISLTNITESDEYTGLLNSPSWLIGYDEGQNEDTCQCKDVYVQTDTADYRLHTSVAVDFELDYHAEISRRLATISWVK